MKKMFYILSAALFIGCGSAPVEQTAEVQVIGHRGGRYEVDENTLSAFVESYNNGVRSYETDIRLTADNELVISHDASLKRIFGVDVNVEQTPRADLIQYNSLKGHPVLFVDELAAFFSDKDIHYVEWEMKSGGYDDEKLRQYCDKLYKTAMKNKPENSTYLFTSFDKRTLRMMQSLHPDADLMLIIGKPISDDCINQALELGVKRLACNMGGTSRDMVNKAKKAGLIVSLWPGQSIEDFQLGVALGADALCCDKAVEVMQFAKKNMPWVKLQKQK